MNPRYRPIQTGAALEDARAGMTTKALMAKYHIGYPRAKKIRREALAVGDPDTAAGTEAAQERGDYSLALNIPKDRIDYLIGGFTLDDAIAVLLDLDEDGKAWAVQFVVQRRLLKVVDPPPDCDLRSIADALERVSKPLPERAMGEWPHLDTEVTAQETDNAETRPNPS